MSNSMQWVEEINNLKAQRRHLNDTIAALKKEVDRLKEKIRAFADDIGNQICEDIDVETRTIKLTKEITALKTDKSELAHAAHENLMEMNERITDLMEMNERIIALQPNMEKMAELIEDIKEALSSPDAHGSDLVPMVAELLDLIEPIIKQHTQEPT